MLYMETKTYLGFWTWATMFPNYKTRIAAMSQPESVAMAYRNASRLTLA